jgi:hypothetical protein
MLLSVSVGVLDGDDKGAEAPAYAASAPLDF